MDRWVVRACEHGHLAHDTRGFLCDRCQGVLSHEFEVVRAMNARSGDPSTSKKAAAFSEPSRRSQRGLALEAIKRAGERGLTAHEAERVTGVRGVWKRISELKQAGFVVVAGERVDPETRAAGEVFVAAGNLRAG